jgi:glycosyltransferase involved in cell wall biosynthesis
VRTPALVSVVIPAYNAAGYLGEQLDALAAQAYGGAWEVVVADNGSTDGTAAVAVEPREALHVWVADASAKKGANAARNAGARAAKGDLLVFCDGDDVAEPGWLAALVEAAATADGVGGRLDDTTLNPPIVREWRESLQSDQLPTSWDFLPYAMAANCAVWRAAFDQLGGFDEAFRYGSDDVDFFWRLQLAGFHLGFAPTAVVQYRYRGSLRDLAKQHYAYGKSEPQRYRKFRSEGAAARPAATVARELANLVAVAPKMLRSPRERGAWVRMASLRAGRIVGSVRWGAVYL